MSLQQALVRAADTPSPVPTPMREIDPATVTPGLLGLVFFIALFVAVFFLMRSFVRQLKKIDIPGDPQSSSDVCGAGNTGGAGNPGDADDAQGANESDADAGPSGAEGGV